MAQYNKKIEERNVAKHKTNTFKRKRQHDQTMKEYKKSHPSPKKQNQGVHMEIQLPNLKS